MSNRSKAAPYSITSSARASGTGCPIVQPPTIRIRKAQSRSIDRAAPGFV